MNKATGGSAVNEAGPSVMDLDFTVPQHMDYDLSVLSGMPSGTGMMLKGRAVRTKFVPDANPDYVFRKGLVLSFMAWMNPESNPEGAGLYLFGPTGSGKTSFINEIAARINQPVIEVTANSRMELSDLVGQLLPTEDGTLKFADGALTAAVRSGAWFILNEGDILDPGVVAGLNEFLQKKELLIPATQELVVAQPGFGFFMTGNTAGMGDDTGSFIGTTRQNIAFLDRLMKAEVDYMEIKDEVLVVRKSLKYIDDEAMRNEFAEKMVQVANAVRDQFTGKSGGNRIELTFSTRTLLRWASLSMVFRNASRQSHGKSGFEIAVEQALTAGARKSTRDAVNGIIQRIIG